MKSLIIEDDYITAHVMQEIMQSFGESDIAEDGKAGLEKFISSLNSKESYNVIFLDIMMPEMDGQQVLAAIREEESKRNIAGLESVKIVMTTALSDFDNVKQAFKNQCEGYIVKPIDKDKVIKKLVDLELVY
ncbi:MAG: response regulator [Candidatus Kapaibacterium sp.]